MGTEYHITTLNAEKDPHKVLENHVFQENARSGRVFTYDTVVKEPGK